VKNFFFVFSFIIFCFSSIKSQPNDILFNVYRNDVKIGYHKVTFDERDNELLALIDINFVVKFLGFTLYDYKHFNKERWKNNKLISVDASTNKNGEELFCKTDVLKEMTIPSSYWNNILISNENVSELKNTQDCTSIQVEITKLGKEYIYNNTLIADRYKIIGKESKGENVDIDIWYNSNNEWVKMVFVKDNSKINYILNEFDKQR
tara:strand:- start:921 stop:1538 length:618 start_codon:yes stop_codon:yes gene_type:complete